MSDDLTTVVADTSSYSEGGDVSGGSGATEINNVAETAATATMTTGPTSRRRTAGRRGGGRSNLTKDQGNKFPQFKYNSGKYHQHVDRRHLPSDGSESNDQQKAHRVEQVNIGIPADRSAGSDDGSSGRPKRMLRRRERNKWKPYHQLSWEEKKTLEEKETRRAELRRNQPTALGFPMAPYNTSQFLMADHKSDHQAVVEDLEGGSSEDSSLADMEGMDNVALDRGYAQEWARVLSVNLENFSKQRLISHVLEVEQEKADLERRLRMLEKEVGRLSDDGRMALQDGDIQMVDGVK